MYSTNSPMKRAPLAQENDIKAGYNSTVLMHQLPNSIRSPEESILRETTLSQTRRYRGRATIVPEIHCVPRHPSARRPAFVIERYIAYTISANARKPLLDELGPASSRPHSNSTQCAIREIRRIALGKLASLEVGRCRSTTVFLPEHINDPILLISSASIANVWFMQSNWPGSSAHQKHGNLLAGELIFVMPKKIAISPGSSEYHFIHFLRSGMPVPDHHRNVAQSTNAILQFHGTVPTIGPQASQQAVCQKNHGRSQADANAPHGIDLLGFW